MYQTDPPPSPKEYLPTMYDLPSEDLEEPGVPDEFHIFQPQLLRETFSPADNPPDRIFVASDLNLYYDVHHPQWYKRPDWFAVLGVSRLHEGRDLRLSYVIWQEGLAPTVVVELLSPGTEKEDLGQTLREVSQPPTKWEVYERILRVPYYIVFDRHTNRLQIFQNLAGRYQELAFTGDRILLPELELCLGLWQGSYQDVERLWLRWYSVDGDRIPTPAELAERERQERELAQQQIAQERQRTEQERQRADQLAARLRESGIDPDCP